MDDIRGLQNALTLTNILALKEAGRIAFWELNYKTKK